jgi:DNA-binding LytR/AlgR family response regulator
VPEIVFITAYDQYAVEAFEQGVADYVLKPAERERLQLTVARIKKRWPSARAASRTSAPRRCSSCCTSSAPRHPAASRLPAVDPGHVGQAIQMIPVEDVLFFISDEKYTRVQTPKVEA